MAHYGSAHQKKRAMMLPNAWGQPCGRCGRVMLQSHDLDLDHGDPGHEGYLGIVHARCNRKAGGTLGRERLKAKLKAKRERWKMDYTRVAVGVEISQGRLHTSIGLAGVVDGEEKTVIALAAYLSGTASALDELLTIIRARAPIAVVIDMHGQASTLIGALEREKVKRLVKASTSDMVVAHGAFLDDLNAGRLRHVEHPRLTEAARAGAQRRLGGAEVWDKRTEVDTSPLTAVTLALHGLRTAKPAPPPLAVL